MNSLVLNNQHFFNHTIDTNIWLFICAYTNGSVLRLWGRQINGRAWLKGTLVVKLVYIQKLHQTHEHILRYTHLVCLYLQLQYNAKENNLLFHIKTISCHYILLEELKTYQQEVYTSIIVCTINIPVMEDWQATLSQSFSNQLL